MDYSVILKEKRIITIFTMLAVIIEMSVLFTGALGLERVLFFIALFIYQIRFMYLIWFLKPRSLTFQAASSQKNPLAIDYLLNALFFVVFPLGYTFLHETFYAKWSLESTVQLIMFGLYLLGTGITMISEYQRKKSSKLILKLITVYMGYLSMLFVLIILVKHSHYQVYFI